jgi:hypothetical protein
MINAKSLIAKLALAAGLVGILASGTVIPSVAQAAGTHYYEPGDNGSVWSFYRGYTDHAGPTRRGADAYAGARGADAYAHVPARVRGHVTPDNPPGSRFEDEGNAEDMGCPC